MILNGHLVSFHVTGTILKLLSKIIDFFFKIHKAALNLRIN